MPAKTSTASGMQSSVTTEEVGPQRVSTKRRSAETADQVFMRSIEEEVKNFQFNCCCNDGCLCFVQMYSISWLL